MDGLEEENEGERVAKSDGSGIWSLTEEKLAEAGMLLFVRRPVQTHKCTHVCLGDARMHTGTHPI